MSRADDQFLGGGHEWLLAMGEEQTIRVRASETASQRAMDDESIESSDQAATASATGASGFAWAALHSLPSRTFDSFRL